jgi:hypothetical protein
MAASRPVAATVQAMATTRAWMMPTPATSNAPSTATLKGSCAQKSCHSSVDQRPRSAWFRAPRTDQPSSVKGESLNVTPVAGSAVTWSSRRAAATNATASPIPGTVQPTGIRCMAKHSERASEVRIVAGSSGQIGD